MVEVLLRVAPPRTGFPAMLLSCGVLFAVGCSGGPKLPPTAPVTCVVTLDGQPLPRGTVQLVPDASRGTAGPPGVGFIDSNGRCEIVTAHVKGAVVGYHKIAVEAREEVDLNVASWSPSLIPEEYGDPDASGLTAEVKPGQKNLVEISLHQEPPK